MAQHEPGSSNLPSCGGRSHPLRVANFLLFPHFLSISFLAPEGFAVPGWVLGMCFHQESGSAERKGDVSWTGWAETSLGLSILGGGRRCFFPRVNNQGCSAGPV